MLHNPLDNDNPMKKKVQLIKRLCTIIFGAFHYMYQNPVHTSGTLIWIDMVPVHPVTETHRYYEEKGTLAWTSMVPVRPVTGTQVLCTIFFGRRG